MRQANWLGWYGCGACHAEHEWAALVAIPDMAPKYCRKGMLTLDLNSVMELIVITIISNG